MDDSLVLELRDLRVHFKLDHGVLKAIDGVDLDLRRGKILGLIGESGCGKSVTSQAIMGIVPDPGKVAGGSIVCRLPDGRSVDLAGLKKNSRQYRAIRGGTISMIFQEPMTSLSPVHTIGRQIGEMVLLHRTKNRAEAKAITLEMLRKVGISNAEQRYDEYPHQLSGGLRQRVMIAMALSCNPAVLIADEPTTALDVTVQAQILALLQSILRESDMAVLYITHDLGVIAEIADEVAVMYLGRVVERGSKQRVFANPLHPYTARLLKSIPKLTGSVDRLEVISGTVPVPLGLPRSCGFCQRCTEAFEPCGRDQPALSEAEPDHFVRCFKFDPTAEACE